MKPKRSINILTISAFSILLSTGIQAQNKPVYEWKPAVDNTYVAPAVPSYTISQHLQNNIEQIDLDANFGKEVIFEPKKSGKKNKEDMELSKTTQEESKDNEEAQENKEVANTDKVKVDETDNQKEEQVTINEANDTQDNDVYNLLLERLCQKETQLEKLEEKFTSFQDSVTKNMLAMENMTKQIMMMNQYGFVKTPSVYDRYESMYPMMMMQQMQYQMNMLTLNQSFQTTMMGMMHAPTLYGNDYTYGQHPEASNPTQMDYLQGSNLGLTFNQDRSMTDLLNGMQANANGQMNWFDGSVPTPAIAPVMPMINNGTASNLIDGDSTDTSSSDSSTENVVSDGDGLDS